MSNADPSKDAQLAALIDSLKAQFETAGGLAECPLEDFFEEHDDYPEAEQLSIAFFICSACDGFPCPNR